MKLRHAQKVQEAVQKSGGRFARITALCWSPNNMRLAVANFDRIVVLYNENGVKKDRFPTKPAKAGGPKNYQIKGLAFSPDSTKIAVAQTDCIVYVYRLGDTWGEKKSICNKFIVDSSVTGVSWPLKRPNELVFGLVDGKAKAGILKIGGVRKQKKATLLQGNASVATLAAGPDGHSVICAFMDKAITRYTFPDPSGNYGASKAHLTTLRFVPWALAWGFHIIAGGNTKEVLFLDAQGVQVQSINLSDDEHCRDFTCASVNPSGQTAVLGNFNGFYVFGYSVAKVRWEQASVMRIENLYTLTAIQWKPDGSKLVTGSLNGAVDMFDACLRRVKYQGKFEFTYTSLSSVIVTRLSNSERLSLKSSFESEITKVHVYKDRYIIAHTADTLIMGDLLTTKLSEIKWAGSGKERFIFDTPSICMVYNAGELSLIEYGYNEILSSCRTEFMSPHLVSLRITPKGNRPHDGQKKIAFLLDLQAIRIMDLVTNMDIATISHDIRIEWLEMNEAATIMLFMDSRRSLHLFNLESQLKITLLDFCDYAQFVPESNVVVAQNRGNLCVWYNIQSPEQATIVPIKGNVEEIERGDGQTEVIVDEGMNKVHYALNEGLILFGTAVEVGKFAEAVDILNEFDLKGGSEQRSMWQRLGHLALEAENFAVARRCYAALGDISKAEFLGEVMNTSSKSDVKAKMAILNKHFKRAETIYLQQNRLNEALLMYIDLHKWESALKLAQRRNHPKLSTLREKYFEHLISTEQYLEAGKSKEEERDYVGAISLYLRGNHPGQAARIVAKHQVHHDTTMLQEIANALEKTKMFEQAGKFLEDIGMTDKALDSYIKGHAFRPAVDLARRKLPDQVVILEDKWGDWLVKQGQMDAGCNHFIEAGEYIKAINAAINAKQFTKAAQILDNVGTDEASEFYERIAQHYKQKERYTEAENFYIRARQPEACVEMYISAGMYDKAHSVAVTYMTTHKVNRLYLDTAQKLERHGKIQEAEQIYIRANEHEGAINMHKSRRNFERMLYLVSKYRKGSLNDTHLQLARQFEGEGNFRQAENHFIKANSWKLAIQMYRDKAASAAAGGKDIHGLWDDALRVAKTEGGQLAYKQIAYAYAVSVGGDAGVKLLTKRGLGEQAVDYAIEQGEWDAAFKIAETTCKQKVPDVHYQHAMILEDEGRFEKAEQEFIRAGKPKEAVDMYIHQQEWEHAMRVAQNHEPQAIADIYEAQAVVAQDGKNYPHAELMFLTAKKPDLAVKMWMDVGNWDAATRVSKSHCPHMVDEVQQSQLESMQGSNMQNLDCMLQQAALFQKNKQWDRAIDTYISITAEDSQDDFEKLTKTWMMAIDVAKKHRPQSLAQVVRAVAERLVGIGMYRQSGDLLVKFQRLKEINPIKEAIEVYTHGRLYDVARTLAKKQMPSMLKWVEDEHSSLLIKNNELGVLASVNSGAAIDILVSQGEWERVYHIASQSGTDEVGKYAVMHARRLLDEDNTLEALKVLNTKPLQLNRDNIELFTDILTSVCQNRSVSEEWKEDDNLYILADQLGAKVLPWIRKSVPNSPELDVFARLTNLCRFCSMIIKAQHYGLDEIAARNAISILRYIDYFPVDKAFYTAGLLSRKVNWDSMAFVFFNRYVDINDLIEEGEQVDQDGAIDNTDFQDTQIPAFYSLQMPSSHLHDEDTREDIREWVLETAVGDVSQELRKMVCFECGVETFEGNLKCHDCSTVSAQCCITGYPVNVGDTRSSVQCRGCKAYAVKSHWNSFIQKARKCPACHTQQSVAF